MSENILRLSVPFASLREDVQMTFRDGQTRVYHDHTQDRSYEAVLMCGKKEYVRITPLQEDFDPFEVEVLAE